MISRGIGCAEKMMIQSKLQVFMMSQTAALLTLITAFWLLDMDRTMGKTIGWSKTPGDRNGVTKATSRWPGTRTTCAELPLKLLTHWFETRTRINLEIHF